MSDLEAVIIPTIAVVVAMGVAYVAHRLGHAEAEAALSRSLGVAEAEAAIFRDLHRQWMERYKSPSSSSMRARIEPVTPKPEAPVRPAGMPMSEWRRRQAGEEEET